nr:capsid protein [Sarcosphaera coronaria partitivirus]
MPFFNPFKRSGTRSKFGKTEDKGKGVQRELPTYQDQDQETGVQDSASKKKEDEKKDDAIDEAAGKENEEEVKDVKATKPTTKRVVKDNIAKDRQRQPTTQAIGRSYQRLWKEMTDYTFHPVKFGTNSYFVPNAEQLDRILRVALPLVARSNWIMKQELGFNPYAVATGYFYLYYVQILRAKEAASDLVGQESSALSRFKKYNAFESIPIPDILIPFYESIVATQMEDTKYSWIVPTWGFDDGTNGEWPNYATFDQMSRVEVADYLRPNVPFMLANLATFGARENRTGLYNHMDSDRVFTPANLDDQQTPPARHNRFRFMNHTHNLNTAANHGPISVLTELGASYPFQFWNDNYADARRDIAESKYFVRNGINFALTVTNPTAAAGTAHVGFTNPGTGQRFPETPAGGLNKIDKYLFVAKENNPIWFEYIRDQMAIFCKHFPTGCKTLADVATTGGLESTVVAQLKLESPVTAGTTEYVYQDKYCGRNDSTIEYYPELFGDLTGAFATSRNDLENEERLQALSIAINANPAVARGTEVLREGRFYQQDLQNETTVQQRIGEMPENVPGAVPMYLNLRDFVKDDFVLKPE